MTKTIYPELMENIAIYRNHVAFWGSPLSNFYHCSFIYDDTEWKSSEQCFMAMKAKFFKDKETYNLDDNKSKLLADFYRNIK